jgi:hypothetical protein
MMLRPLRKSKPWWDTRLARGIQVGDGIAARVWLFHFFPTAPVIPANDRDHLRW